MNELKTLTQFNLNLLIPLKALLDFQSVSAAAEYLNSTQPTMSRHLANLRELLNDTLLVRVGSTYQLTPKALTLKPDLDNLIIEISEMFCSVFHPEKDKRQFVIACPDYVSSYALYDSISEYLNKDNELEFSILNWDQQARKLFLDGGIDFVISIEEDFGANYIRKKVDSGDWVCLMRNDHPILQLKQPSIEEVLSYPFVRVITGSGIDKEIERQLRKLKLKRNIKLNTQSYFPMYSAVTKSDMLAFVPRHQARAVASDFNLTYMDIPISLPKIYWSIYWHEKYNNDTAHKWFREHIIPKLMVTDSLLDNSRHKTKL